MNKLMQDDENADNEEGSEARCSHPFHQPHHRLPAGPAKPAKDRIAICNSTRPMSPKTYRNRAAATRSA
jgi:hypothetical protein